MARIPVYGKGSTEIIDWDYRAEHLPFAPPEPRP